MREGVISFIFVCVIISGSAFGVVEFDGVDNGDGTITIAYTTTEGEQLRGIALNLLCSGTLTIESVESWDCFNVFIDYAFDNAGSYEVGDGYPIADPAGLGVGTLPASEISVCMGYLDEDGDETKGEPGPSECANLITLSVSGFGEVIVTGDTLRGPDSGVVGSGGEIASNLPIVILIGHCCHCMQDTNPDYDRWVSLDSPDCWCYEFQCRGDADGLMQFGVLSVYTDDLAVFLSAYGQMDISGIDGGICADFDHLVQFGVLPVYTDDLALFLASYGQMEVAPCAGPGSGTDEDPLPNSLFFEWLEP